MAGFQSGEDALQPFLFGLFLAFGKDGTFKRHCFQLLLKLGRGTVDNIVKTDRLGTNLLRAGEIGRASCRERV